MKKSLLIFFLLLAIITSLTAGTLAVYANAKVVYKKQAEAKLPVFAVEAASLPITPADTRL
jgi:hypothetical protein